MQTVMLDGNVFDSVANDVATQSAIRYACKSGSIRIIISPVVMQELQESPFGGIPEFFPVEVVVESVAVAGLAIPGLAIPGEGNVFSAHLGKSHQGADAVIADSASTYADVFVSEDSRCRKRLMAIQPACRCLTYPEFCEWIASIGKTRKS